MIYARIIRKFCEVHIMVYSKAIKVNDRSMVVLIVGSQISDITRNNVHEKYSVKVEINCRMLSFRNLSFCVLAIISTRKTSC
jgi:hypothetical protein